VHGGREEAGCVGWRWEVVLHLDDETCHAGPFLYK
jgi:hypothetical protein